MTNDPLDPALVLTPLRSYGIVVLLVDDQEIIGEAVRHMLQNEPDITFHFCKDASKAIDIANEVHPTVVLQDLVMPEIEGLMLVKFFRANPTTKDVPLVVLSSTEDPAVKAEAFALGANDYMVKLPDKIEVLARIRYHSSAYIRLLERNQAYDQLSKSRQLLLSELSEAASYVRSLLPKPINDARIKTSWRYFPSAELGGDAFGYQWLDDDHFAVFLLDVCGHGVGAALLGVTVMSVLTSRTLQSCDFFNPSSVLYALNETFPMEKYNNMFFTIWYGVYRCSERLLSYASGGHPPAVLVSSPGQNKTQYEMLKTSGLVIGGMPGAEFPQSTCHVHPGDRLFIFSDGVYEITKPDGSVWTLEDFLQLLDKSKKKHSELDTVVSEAKELSGSDTFADDFSIIRIAF